MKNRNLKHSDNWGTPKEFYNKLNEEFNFDFDPCPLNTGGRSHLRMMDFSSNGGKEII